MLTEETGSLSRQSGDVFKTDGARQTPRYKVPSPSNASFFPCMQFIKAHSSMSELTKQAIFISPPPTYRRATQRSRAPS